MKRILLASSLLLAPLAAQSFEYVHGGVGFRCEALTDDHAVFTFTGGVIRYTTDGGATIHNADVPDDVRVTLRGMHFGSDAQGSYGYCVGSAGTVLFSDDDGLSWSQLPVVTTPANHPFHPSIEAQLWDCWFPTRQHGFLVGFDHTLMETTDGGQTWVDVAPGGHIAADNPEWYQLHGFSDGTWVAVADNGWTVRCTPQGMASKLISDTQFCYAPQITPAQPWNMELWAIDFVGDSGLAVGGIGNNDGYIFRSDDRGANWTLDTACYDFLNAGNDGGTPPSFYGIELYDDAAGGCAVGYGSSAFQGGMSTTATAPSDCPGCPSGGKAWTQVVCDTDHNQTVDPEDDGGAPLLRDICASPSLNRTYALGDFGLVRRSDDRGNTWSELAGLHRGRIQCGDFSDGQVGVIAGQLWRVYSTVDGGENFSLDYAPNIPVNPATGNPYGGNFHDVAIADDGFRAVVVGDHGQIAVRDLNGNWHDRSLGTWAHSPRLSSAMAIGDGSILLVAGEYLNGASLYVSLDGGISGFIPLPLTFAGQPLTVGIADFAFDGNYVYYLGTDDHVYVATVQGFLTPVAALPLVGNNGNATCIAVRNVLDFYVGNNQGQLFRPNLATLSMRPVGAVDPADLGGYVWDIEAVPGSTDWWFSGHSGHVVQQQGATFNTPKSAMADNVVGVEFFGPDDGLIFGRKTNVTVW